MSDQEWESRSTTDSECSSTSSNSTNTGTSDDDELLLDGNYHPVESHEHSTGPNSGQQSAMGTRQASSNVDEFGISETVSSNNNDETTTTLMGGVKSTITGTVRPENASYDDDQTVFKGEMERQQKLLPCVLKKVVPSAAVLPIFHQTLAFHFQSSCEFLVKALLPYPCIASNAPEVGAGWVAMEHMSSGAFDPLYIKAGPSNVTTRQFIEIALQTLLGLSHLHENGRLHRDLSPKNVLWQQNDDNLSDYKVSVKISDFNARKLESNDEVMSITHTEYAAPEVFPPRGLFSPQSDIWSWACTVIAIATGIPPSLAPYSPEHLANSNIPENIRPKLMSCFDRTAQNRPAVAELKTLLEEKHKELTTAEESSKKAPPPVASASGHVLTATAAPFKPGVFIPTAPTAVNEVPEKSDLVRRADGPQKALSLTSQMAPLNRNLVPREAEAAMALSPSLLPLRNSAARLNMDPRGVSHVMVNIFGLKRTKWMFDFTYDPETDTFGGSCPDSIQMIYQNLKIYLELPDDLRDAEPKMIPKEYRRNVMRRNPIENPSRNHLLTLRCRACGYYPLGVDVDFRHFSFQQIMKFFIGWTKPPIEPPCRPANARATECPQEEGCCMEFIAQRFIAPGEVQPLPPPPVVAQPQQPLMMPSPVVGGVGNAMPLFGQPPMPFQPVFGLPPAPQQQPSKQSHVLPPPPMPVVTPPAPVAPMPPM